MPARPPTITLPPLGQRFKTAIEKAEREGASLSALVLQLTRRDEAKLKRDQSIPTQDIAFAGGEMRYLGVRVAVGEVESSALTGWPLAEPSV